VLAGALLGARLGAQDAPAASPPNVLVFLADDLGYGDIGVHGCREIPTPNIDQLAAEGVRCTSGYVTSPRCSPSRCGLLTGRTPQRYGCELGADNGLPAEERLLPELLTPAGYASGLVGKWHLGNAPEDLPSARGFGEFFGFLGGVSISLPRHGNESIPRIQRNGRPASVPGYLTDALRDEALGFLERHRARPFFLLVAFNAPHEPVEAPAEALERFTAIQDPMRRRYAAAVASLDAAVGAVLTRLDELALAERTLVFFLSDNGGPQSRRRWNGSSNRPLRGNKGSLWEAGIRVPFLVRWKGSLPAGRVYDAPVSTLDLVPTVLALAGATPALPLDGVDILPHLAGRTGALPHEALFWRFNFPAGHPADYKWAVRVGDLKLVHSPERDEETLEPRNLDLTALFDLARDPGETHDLAAAQPERVAELMARWQAWNQDLPVLSPPAREDEREDELEHELQDE
jgi:arylsulfatase A-like enzyme